MCLIHRIRLLTTIVVLDTEILSIGRETVGALDLEALAPAVRGRVFAFPKTAPALLPTHLQTEARLF